MKTETYRYNESKVIIENNIVTYSDVPEYCVINQKPNRDFLKRCGWKKEKETKVSDAYLIKKIVRIK